MFSKRGIDYLAGALFFGVVATVVVSIVTNPISAEVFREDPSGVLMDIVEDRSLFIVSAALDFASNLITIPLAAILYIAFRSHDRTLALMGSFGFLSAAVLFLISNMVYFSMVTLAEDYAAASGAQADSVLTGAIPIGLMADAAVTMGFIGLAIGALSYGLLVVTTGALPRWIGVFGILGGIVAPFGLLLFVEADLVFVGFIGAMIVLFFGLLTGGALVLRGRSEPAQ